MRYRAILKKVYVNQEEEAIIQYHMERMGINNFSNYARKVLVNPAFLEIHQEGSEATLFQLKRIGNNINQIAVKFNERNADLNDIQALKQSVGELIELVKQSDRTMKAELRQKLNQKLEKMAGEVWS